MCRRLQRKTKKCPTIVLRFQQIVDLSELLRKARRKADRTAKKGSFIAQYFG